MFFAMTFDIKKYTDRLVARYNRNLPNSEHEIKRFFGPGCFGGMPVHLANRITLVGHASTTHFGGHPDYGHGDFAGYKPKELANAIVNESRLPNTPGIIIDLVGCEIGLSFAGQPSYAEKFAKIMAEEYGYNIQVRSFSSEVFDQHLPTESKIVQMLVTSDHDPPGVVRIIGIPLSQANVYDQYKDRIDSLEKEEKEIGKQTQKITIDYMTDIITTEQWKEETDKNEQKLTQVMQDKVSAKKALEDMENGFVLFTSYEQENNKDMSVRAAIDAVGKSYHFPPAHRDFYATTIGQLETSIYIPTSDEAASDTDCTVAKPGMPDEEILSPKASNPEPSASAPWEKKRSEYATRSGERLTALATNKKTKHEDGKSNIANSQLTSSSFSKGKK